MQTAGIRGVGGASRERLTALLPSAPWTVFLTQRSQSVHGFLPAFLWHGTLQKTLWSEKQDEGGAPRKGSRNACSLRPAGGSESTWLG